MTSTAPPGDRSTYRGHLDGLRAVSVLMVVVQHLTHVSRFYLGATGVALFFALSGYLITGLLLDELEGRGRLRLGRFYLRRTARLMPGLLAMLVTGSLLLAGAGQVAALSGVLPSALYVNNYASILAGGAHLNLAFGHTWSLAVEEHFYLVWPLVLLAGHRRLGPRRLLVMTLALCLAALGYRAVVAVTVHASPVFFYFDSLSRADSILYGCAACLAVRQGWRPRRWQLVAAVILMGGFLDANPLLISGLLGSLVSGLAGAVIVAGVDRGAGSRTVRRCLDLAPLRYLGARSYSLYLWHLPLLAYAIAVVHVDSFSVRLVGVALSLPFALAAYRWVETPVRDAVRARTSDREPPAAVPPALVRSGQAG